MTNPPALSLVGNDHSSDEDKTPTSDGPLLSAIQREIIEEIHELRKALIVHAEEDKARTAVISESVQALHEAIRANNEADARRAEHTHKALATLTDWVESHVMEHRAIQAHREKQDSISEIKDAEQSKAIHQIEVEKALLAAQVAQHEAKLAQMWATRGKAGAVLGAIVSIGEVAARLSGADGLIGLIRSLLGG